MAVPIVNVAVRFAMFTPVIVAPFAAPLKVKPVNVYPAAAAPAVRVAVSPCASSDGDTVGAVRLPATGLRVIDAVNTRV